MKQSIFRRLASRCLLAVPALALALSLDACGTTEGTAESAEETAETVEEETPEEEATTETDGTRLARRVERLMLRTSFLSERFSSIQRERGCGSNLSWHCFLERYESPQPGRIDVHLSFPDDVSDSEKARHAEDARLHTISVAGYRIEELETVVSFTDGVDSGTTTRDQVPFLNN